MLLCYLSSPGLHSDAQFSARLVKYNKTFTNSVPCKGCEPGLKGSPLQGPCQL